jgi:hypothetical protein
MRIHSPQITGSAENTNIVTTTSITSLSALSSSFASTASFANNFTVGGTLTAQTINVQTITSSIEFITGSTRNGTLLTNTHQFTGSVSITGSLTLRGEYTAFHNTVDQVTNFERANIGFTSGNQFDIFTTVGGSGNARSLGLYSGLIGRGITVRRDGGSAGHIQFNVAGNSAAGSVSYNFSGMSISSTGQQYGLYFTPNVVQTGTGSYSMLYVSAYEQTTGSGVKNLIDLGTNSATGGTGTHTTKFSVQSNGTTTIIGSLNTSGSSTISGSVTSTVGFTGSLQGTSSYALQANTASFALTASYISGSGGGVGFPFSGSAIITGSLFVSGSTISGSFVGDGSGITGLTAGGKIHTQTSEASTWTVSHNLGVQYPNVTVYDNSNNVIIPQTIVATDANTLTLTFGSAVAGYAVAGIGGIINVQGRTTQQYFTASTTWSFAHNLGDKYVSLQAFDDAFEMMIPTTIRLVDFTSSLLLFDSASSGYAVATIGGDLPAISSSYAGFTLQVASSAPYSASWVAVPNVTVTNAVSSSFAATASSADNLTVRGTLTAQTINVQTITSSIEFITGSTRNGSIAANTHQFTGSVLMSGSLGIGTNLPSAQIHIVGNSSSELTTGVKLVRSEQAGQYVVMNYESGIANFTAVDTAFSGPQFRFNTSTNGTTSTERVRITKDGNVGIGIVPNTGWSSFTALQLGGNTYNALASSNHYLNISANTYYDGTNFRYITTNFATRYQQSDGTHLWYIGPSGTAGNAVSFTTAMSITSAGRVLIGTTTASAGAGGFATSSLHVDGEIVSKGSLAGVFWENRSGGTTDQSNWYGLYTSAGTIYVYNGAGNIANINGSSGAYTATSDINKKKDFEQSNIGLNEVLQLNPTLYRMKTDGEFSSKYLGFIAQEVKEFIPQAYSESGEGDNKFIGLTEMPIIAALTKAVQELSAKVTALENK